MTFDPTDIAYKAQLYPVLKAIAALNPPDKAEDVLDKALGKPLARGTDYMKNVQRGNFDRSLAAIVHRWLMRNHFPLAHEISPKIFPETIEMRWRKVLDERAIKGRLTIKLYRDEMGIVQRRSELLAADQTIKLGHEFVFELDSETAGYAVALQGVRGRWLPLDIGPDDGTVFPIVAGVNTFPRLENGELDPIREEHDAGLHEFVFVVAQASDLAFEIEQLVVLGDDLTTVMHRLQVKFVE